AVLVGANALRSGLLRVLRDHDRNLSHAEDPRAPCLPLSSSVAVRTGRAIVGRREGRSAGSGPEPRAAARRRLFRAEHGEHGEDPPFPRWPTPGLEPAPLRGG